MSGPCEFWYGAARSANACWSVTGIRYFTLPIRPVIQGRGFLAVTQAGLADRDVNGFRGLTPRGWKGVNFKRC